MAKPKIGDERFLVEHITASDAEFVARENGWDGGEGLLDYCDAGMAAAKHTAHSTFDEALSAARASLASGLSLFGCSIIDRQRFDILHGCPPAWEDQQSWEVDALGEPMEINQ